VKEAVVKKAVMKKEKVNERTALRKNWDRARFPIISYFEGFVGGFIHFVLKFVTVHTKAG
jgi:hypothetical protein